MATVVVILAVSPAFVNVAEPVTSPVSSTVTALDNASASSAVPVKSPVTLPTKVASTVLFIINLSDAEAYRIVAVPSMPRSTVRPAVFAAAASAAPLATVMFRSSTSSVVVLRLVVVPLTVKFPLTIKLSSTVTSRPDCAAMVLEIIFVAVIFAKVTSSVVATACPILNSPVVLS